MYSIIPEEDESIVINSSQGDKDVLRIVVTEGVTEIALALLHRIFSDDIFGKDQSIFVSLYESRDKGMFLESVAIELTTFSPNLLQGIIHTDDLSIAFKDADVAFLIGKARGYDFAEEEYTDFFFEESVLLAKSYGEAIERYAKRDVKVIVLGATPAIIVLRYAKSISPRNITVPSMFNLQMTMAHVAAQVNCRPDEIKNIIIWGTDNKYIFPDCRHMSFTNTKTVTNEAKVWIRNILPGIIKAITNRSVYTRSLAYAMAEHCKILWNGTPEGEWTSMGVLSDNSYGVCSGIFFSYPIICKDKQYEIVHGLAGDEYIKKHIEDLSKRISRETNAAFKICGLK